MVHIDSLRYGVSKGLAASIQIGALFLWSSVKDAGTLRQLGSCLGLRSRTKRRMCSPRITESGV